MKQRFVLILALLIMVSYVSFQRSRLLYLSYQSNLRQAEKRNLENQELVLLRDVHRTLPITNLYQEWKANHPELGFACQNSVADGEAPRSKLR